MKEEIEDIAARFFDPNSDPSGKAYYDRLVEQFKKVFEAGKQAKEREIVEKLEDYFDNTPNWNTIDGEVYLELETLLEFLNSLSTKQPQIR